MSVTTQRPASTQDAAAIAHLIHQLGYAVTAAEVAQTLAQHALSQGDCVLLAVTATGQSVGCIGLHAMPLLHTAGRLGRITALVVDEGWRGQGIGSALLMTAQGWFEAAGCQRVEVTSADHREDAHRLYRRHGYARQGHRLLRDCADGASP
ncbi:MAG: GNAT family N-acetyltransferase [Dyella sp.]